MSGKETEPSQSRYPSGESPLGKRAERKLPRAPEAGTSQSDQSSHGSEDTAKQPENGDQRSNMGINAAGVPCETKTRTRRIPEADDNEWFGFLPDYDEPT